MLGVLIWKFGGRGSGGIRKNIGCGEKKNLNLKEVRIMEREMKKVSGRDFPRGDFPVSVDWDAVVVLEGVIADKKVIVFDGQERKCLTLRSVNGKNFTVWESKGLALLFKINEGVFVRIKNLGMKELKNDRRLRLFDIFADKGQLEIPF